jgi:hypothetical protein
LFFFSCFLFLLKVAVGIVVWFMGGLAGGGWTKKSTPPAVGGVLRVPEKREKQKGQTTGGYL